MDDMEFLFLRANYYFFYVSLSFYRVALQSAIDKGPKRMKSKSMYD